MSELFVVLQEADEVAPEPSGIACRLAFHWSHRSRRGYDLNNRTAQSADVASA